MNTRKILILSLAIIILLFLAGCGTFEIGIESNTILEPTIQTVEVPDDSTQFSPTEEPTAQPDLRDEAQIEAALAEKLGYSVEEIPFAITQLTEEHAMGNVSNGYFLAAKQAGEWVIVYDGQANPPCRDIDFTGFSSEMVPECVNENGQLIDRTGGDYALIGEALAEYHGEQPGETNYSIIYVTGNHALGHAKQGYFLAAKAAERWLIAFAGNGTPYCAQVDLHNFPPDMVPECVDADNNLVYRTVIVGSPEASQQTLNCRAGSAGAIPGTAEYVACNVQDGLLSRNTSALIGYMADPFIIGYWQSEGVSGNPEEMLTSITGLYNFNALDYSPRLSFTADRSLFPDLGGIVPEDMFGPDVNIVLVVYSQGWGLDGQSASLLFFTRDDDGSYKWHGMAFSGNNFSS